ncbi:cytochrome P450 4d2-like [Lutzomyia longipalpis]|uniref:cytochrome P450 4d2-like n=1 Tax=Lutzomyia longipalpis TaxID=7200 RepID=UPI00248472F2|nr:cytochrome P450 4d2-like [Lutzomyia longipalpis]
MSVLLVAVVIFILIVVLDYAEKVKRLWGSCIGGPIFLPIIGNAHQVILKKPTDFFDLLQEGVRHFGDVSRVWVLNMLFISITDPEYVEPILNSSTHISKAQDYSFLQPWLGDGLLLTTGKKWHIRRKIITPAFHFKILDNFVKIFDKQARIFVKKLGQFDPGSSVDVYPLVSLLTFDVICESAMGTSVDVQLNKNSEYVEGVQEITNILHKRMYNAFLRFKFFFRLSRSGIRERKIVKTLNKWTEKLIEKRREDLLRDNIATKKIHGDTAIGEKDKMVLLDVLLQATVDGQTLVNEDIREEVSTFMFAGHDTTTSGIAFLLYNIALYPDVQEKIVDEIRYILGMNPNKDISLGDLKNLSYLECVIKESLRLFPPVPMIGRYFEEDTQLKDIKIPAKSTVIIGAFFMGRNATLFPEPNAFKPERFVEDETTMKKNPYSYIPFSAGPRNCIGQKFALMEMKTIVVRILQSFRISVDSTYDKPRLVAAIVLRPKNGILLNFQKRE